MMGTSQHLRMYNNSYFKINLLLVTFPFIAREGILRKKHSCGFIFSKLCYTPIFLIHIFSIK